MTGFRIVYLSNARLPSEKANALQSLQQCEALGRKVPLEFWHPRRAGTVSTADEIFRRYGVKPTFTLRTIGSADSQWLRRTFNRAGFLVQAASFQAMCLQRLMRERGPIVIYTRNPLDVLILPLLRRVAAVERVFLEDHDGLGRRAPALKRRLLASADGLIVTTNLHAAAAQRMGLGADKILVAPNGVDLARFPRVPRPCPDPPYRIVYVGNLFQRKGVFTLVEALARLPPHYTLDVIGGSPESKPAFDAHVESEGVADRIATHGVLPPAQVPPLLQRAHVAILPNSSRSEVSSMFTSPLKMFEYMAAGVPIVASDVPAIRQVLRHGENAWLVPPDDAAALADAIAHVCGKRALGDQLARQARADAEARTWDARTSSLLAFMGLTPSGIA